ncbi:hypothetical protein ACLMJK_002106 [Lecanora helva]
MAPSVFQLECSCNNYPWGRVGKDSLAASLCYQTPNTSFKIEDKPYAEMWMGDYPVLPAKVLSTGEELHKIVDENKEQLLGENCIAKFGGVVPFLPKILSIAKALTLQIHPNKDLAAKLHKENPEQFTDPNHKPEIAIALGPFELFGGWKPTSDIQSLFDSLPPLQKYLPDKKSDFNNETLRKIVQIILKSSDESIKTCQRQLAEIPKEKYGKQSYILGLLPRLQNQYSVEDPGTLVALITMNFLTLNAGDAVYIPADAPHAYLSGNIVECMARSNNILNTGFCPRPDRDNIDIFSAALTFSPHNADEVMLPKKKSGKGREGKTSVYAPPMSEFDMLVTELGKGEREVQEKVGGPSVVFATSGKGRMRAGGEEFEIRAGFVFFVGQGVEMELVAEDGLVVWRAYAE